MFADRAYDHHKYREQVRAVRITPIIAHRGVAHGSGLGKYRWVVEQALCAARRRCAVRRWESKEVQDLLAGLSQQPGRS